MGRFFTFLMFFVISTQMGTFPSSKVDKAMIELQFYRTRNENNFSQATTFCDQKNSRDRHNEALTNLFKQHLTSCLSEREEKTFLSRKFSQLPTDQEIRCYPCKPNVFLSNNSEYFVSRAVRRNFSLFTSMGLPSVINAALQYNSQFSGQTFHDRHEII